MTIFRSLALVESPEAIGPCFPITLEHDRLAKISQPVSAPLRLPRATSPDKVRGALLDEETPEGHLG